MTRIERNEILEPLLENVYPDEDSFNRAYRDIKKKGGELYLSEPIGISIALTNIIENNYVDSLIKNIKKNRNDFIPKIDDPNEIDQMDKRLFDDKSEYSFTRYKFKFNERIDAGIKDKNNKKVDLSMYISIAQTNLNHHIISFILTTWNDSGDPQDIRDSHVELSNKQIINLIHENSTGLEKIREVLIKHDPKLGDLLKIDQNTFIGIEIWRSEWRNSLDNPDLDAKKVIIENPFYFYSLLKLDEDVSRRKYKIVVDSLGRVFSTSTVQMVLSYDRVYLELSLKPLNTRFDANGHDATLFRAWELLGLQRYLLESKYKCFTKYRMGKLVEKLDVIYESSKIFNNSKKGDLWIKYTTYLQDQIGISSSYNKFMDEYKMMPNAPRKKARVFIAYVREDYEAAKRLSENLRKNAIDVFLDKESIGVGQRWKAAINRAIKDHEHFMPIISTCAINKKGYYQTEIKEALDILRTYPPDKNYILPVRLDDCITPYDELNEFQWADMFPDWDEGLERILEAINGGPN